MSDQGAGTLTPEEVAAIKSVNEVFGGYVVSQDFETLVQLYTADVVMMPPGSPVVYGRDALLAFFQGFPPVTKMEVTPTHIEGRGDLAYVLGRYVMVIEPPGGDPITDHGKFIEIRKKQPDGSWPVAADIFNSDLGHE